MIVIMEKPTLKVDLNLYECHLIVEALIELQANGFSGNICDNILYKLRDTIKLLERHL